MTVVGVAMALSGLPQVVRLLKRRSAADISLTMFSMFIFGQAWWVWYGFQKDSPCLILTNSAAFLVNSIIIFLAIRFRRQT
jgi:MtN3 and saliva related transmembrane protein